MYSNSLPDDDDDRQNFDQEYKDFSKDDELEFYQNLDSIQHEFDKNCIDPEEFFVFENNTQPSSNEKGNQHINSENQYNQNDLFSSQNPNIYDLQESQNQSDYNQYYNDQLSSKTYSTKYDDQEDKLNQQNILISETENLQQQLNENSSLNTHTSTEDREQNDLQQQNNKKKIYKPENSRNQSNNIMNQVKHVLQQEDILEKYLNEQIQTNQPDGQKKVHFSINMFKHLMNGLSDSEFLRIKNKIEIHFLDNYSFKISISNKIKKNLDELTYYVEAFFKFLDTIQHYRGNAIINENWGIKQFLSKQIKKDKQHNLKSSQTKQQLF